MEVGGRRECSIDLSGIEDDYERDAGRGERKLQWEYEYDFGAFDEDGSEEGEVSGFRESSSGASSYSPSLTGSAMELDS